jgi:hypothetical protein
MKARLGSKLESHRDGPADAARLLELRLSHCWIVRDCLESANDAPEFWFVRGVSDPGNRFRGAVAQLGERLNGIQEVIGSIPFGSTNQIERFAPTGNGRRFRFVCVFVCNARTEPTFAVFLFSQEQLMTALRSTGQSLYEHTTVAKKFVATRCRRPGQSTTTCASSSWFGRIRTLRRSSTRLS